MKNMSAHTPEATAEQLAGFIGKTVEKTTGFVVNRGLSMAETATLLVLQRTARMQQLRQAAHTMAPPVSQLLTAARRVSPALPFLAGLVAKRSALLGFKIGLKALKLSGRAGMMMCKKK